MAKKKISVLLVDDNKDILFSLKAALESMESYKVTTANSGKECLDFLKKNVPDFILLDIMMPDMDGWDVLAKIRERKTFEHIPVAFLTGKTDPVTQMTAKVSVDKFFIKPPDLNDLNKTIKQLVAK